MKYFIDFINKNKIKIQETNEKKLKEKAERYRNAAKDYKQNNELLIEQLSILKEEIRSQKNQNTNLLNFEGRIKDYESFKNLFSISVENYKPKKKEQEESLKNIKEHLGYQNSDLNADSLLVDNSEKKKGGLMGFFSKKK